MESTLVSETNAAEPAQPVKESENLLVLSVLRHMSTKWWLFLVIGLLGGICGYIYASRQKTLYKSDLTFALDEGGSEGGSMSGALGLASQFGISLGGARDVFTGENILEILMSRRIIERVLLSVDTFENKPYTMAEYYLEKLADKDAYRNEVLNIHFLPGEDKSKFSYSKDSLLYLLYTEFARDYITAGKPNKKLNIYQVSVTSSNEKFTKVFTDKLISETNNFYVEITSKKSKETLDILEKRAPVMKNRLNESISNRANVEDANVNPAFAAAQVPLLKEQSNAQVYGTAYAEVFKNLEMARFQYLKSIPLMQIIDDAHYPMQKIKVGKLKTAVIFSVTVIFTFLIIFVPFSVFSHLKKNRILISR